MDEPRLYEMIRRVIVEILKPSNEEMVLKGEEGIVNSWGIRRPKITREKKKKCSWKAPSENWVKINFDGVSKGNAGEARLGGLCRNLDGMVRWAFVQYYGQQSNHSAELKAM